MVTQRQKVAGNTKPCIPYLSSFKRLGRTWRAQCRSALLPAARRLRSRARESTAISVRYSREIR